MARSSPLRSITELAPGETVRFGPARWVWIVAATGLYLIVLAVGMLGLVKAGQGASRAGVARQLLEAQRAASARADCRTEYNAVLNESLKIRDNLAIQANIDFAGYLLGDPTTKEAKLLENRNLLQAAEKVVDEQPALAEAMRDGFSLRGVTYPPCPVVP